MHLSPENRSEKVNACAARLKTNLELLGATAVEDKLREGVPRTGARLSAALLPAALLLRWRGSNRVVLATAARRTRRSTSGELILGRDLAERHQRKHEVVELLEPLEVLQLVGLVF